MDIQNTLRDVEQRAQEAARGKKSALGGLNAIVVLSGPVIYPFLYTLWGTIPGWILAGGFLLVVAIHGYLAYLSYTLSTADNFYFDYRDLERKYVRISEEKNAISRRLRREEIITSVLRLMLAGLSNFATVGRSNAPLSPAYLRDRLKKLLIPLIASPEVVPFGGARYNFAVYLYDDTSDVLKMFYRHVHPGISVQNRDIDANHGHIGTCYSKQEPIFSPDTLKAPALMFQGETEDTPYRSIGAAPISTIPTVGGTSNVRGVFIITSDEPGQIQEEQHKEFVLAVTRIVSLFFDEADQHLSPTQTYV